MPEARLYNYVPVEWKIHGDSSWYCGLEIETRCGYVPKDEKDIENDEWVLKQDSSISGNYEIVTHPFCYNDREMIVPIVRRFRDKYDCRGWRYNHAVHIHVCATFFSEREKRRLFIWMRKNKQMVSILVARRNNTYYAEFSDDIEQFSSCKYLAVANRGNTLEFRIFKSTTNIKSLMGYIDFVHSLSRWIKGKEWQAPFEDYLFWAFSEGYYDLACLVYREASRGCKGIKSYKRENETIYSTSDE
jgi:hypothetical protein